MSKKQLNGTVKTLATVIVTAVLLGGLIWGIALDSGSLGRCKEDVVELKAAIATTQVSTHEIEKSMIAMQGDVKRVKTDVATILQMQRTILDIPDPPDPP